MTASTSHGADPPAGTDRFVLAPRAYHHPDAWDLVAALHAEQLTRYGFADDPHDTDPAEFVPPLGLFLVGYVGDDPVACGGLRTWDPTTAEIKRMYVRPVHRGRGYGHRLLQTLEDAARARGAVRLILETGARNVEAIGLYTRAGFERAPAYMGARDPRINRAFAKDLESPASPSAREVQG